MTALPSVTESLALKRDALDAACHRMIAAQSDPHTSIRDWIAGRDFVLFCGAGVSIPSPAAAPAFLDLRNAVVLSLADILVERGILQDLDREPIDVAMHQLEKRADLALPPELVFADLDRGVGFDVVSRLLSECLGRGKPNMNHLAVRKLVQGGSPKVIGIITPNFDLYFEQAFDGLPYRRSICGNAPVGAGVPLFKPHGSLDLPNSLAVTFHTISKPLKGIARQTFRELTQGHPIIVIGYSGWDYDLLPLLINAGREWDADILWLVHDEGSFNERVAMAALALGERVTIVNSQREPLLPTLAALGPQIDAHVGVQRPIRDTFLRILREQSSDGLITALITLVTPAGVQQSESVTMKLGAELLRLAESDQITSDSVLLGRMGLVVNSTTGGDRRRAAGLALSAAKRLANEAAVLTWERIVAGGEDEPRTAADRLHRTERDLKEFPFAFTEPDSVMAATMTRAGLRIEQALLLEDLRRDREAEMLAQQILRDTTFPSSAVAEEAWIVEDAKRPWELHCLLGQCAARHRDLPEMEHHFCEALNLLWRFVDFWDLHSALLRIADATRDIDRDCAEAAMNLTCELMRFCRDHLSELFAIEWKAEFGFAVESDLVRARELLDTMTISDEERKAHLHTLRQRDDWGGGS